MSKKHYKLIASMIRQVIAAHGESMHVTLIIHGLCDILKSDNRNFNKQKFLDACYPDEMEERK